ncbi:calcitonin gene-related peptide type 1 receptor-like isoform X1 [Agrilus planipennis]|uniref:Calcitonin gene-related peptide type 1 receptor-like isoform X1 n=1 Tax=Agrilus planipennis TaxID=224129 RepID=A0A1W4X1S2_AGRPL|nr:calcitonin gene-related peptide type 1 receptor-like isoform X1 [Agrilus planipennis]
MLKTSMNVNSSDKGISSVEDILQIIKETCENATSELPRNESLYCPPKWDSLLCWPLTPAGATANQSCPRIYGYDTKRFAFRECWTNGSWYIHPISKKDWSNYTTCVNNEDLEFRSFINHLFVIGYSISLAALLTSLIIFFMFKSLRCTRINVHIQLFISFAANNCMWIIWYKQVVSNPKVVIDNPVWCQSLHLLIYYFMVANYMWMFCEGLHLHLVLVVVFIRDEVAMRWFFVIGWSVPLILILIYGLVRYNLAADTKHCWIDDSHSTWILTIPVCVSLLGSFVFLINVLRVIITIMHSQSNQPAPLSVRRAVRAALILVPLFGLQHILIPLRPDIHDPYEHLYQYITVVVVSLQGFCVSCLFCFANHDVHHAVRVFIYRKTHSSRWTNYHYTGPLDSGGIFVVNGNTPSNNMMMI